jgi:hypothetical protein
MTLCEYGTQVGSLDKREPTRRLTVKQLSPEHELQRSTMTQLSAVELGRVSGGDGDLKQCSIASVPWALAGGISGSHYKGRTGLVVGGLVSGAAAFFSTSACTDGLKWPSKPQGNSAADIAE